MGRGEEGGGQREGRGEKEEGGEEWGLRPWTGDQATHMEPKSRRERKGAETGVPQQFSDAGSLASSHPRNVDNVCRHLT